MIPYIAPLHAIITLNTGLVRNAVDGIDDDASRTRPLDGANSVAYLLAHIIGSRFLMARTAGAAPVDNPIDAYITPRTPIDAVTSWPTMVELLAAWTAASTSLESAMAALTADGAAQMTEFKLPVADRSVGGILAFFTQHDSYHLGQLSMLRKHLTGSAMSYKVG